MTEKLHPAARQLIAARSEVDVHHVAVSSLARLTGADSCEIALATDGSLQVRATVTFGPPHATETSPLSTHREIVERAYESAEPGLIDDLASLRDADVTTETGEEPSYRSLLTVPIEGEGLLVAADRDPDFFAAIARPSLDRLADYVHAALDRTSAGPDDRSRHDAVATVISHDVQNALTVANGRLSVVMDDVDHEQLPVVDAAHDRLFDMTDDLVTVLRTGDSVTSIEPVDLEREAFEAWRAIETADATLSVEDSATFLADRTSLRQLLENLYRNAVEHGSTSPRSSSTHENAVEHAADDVAVVVGTRTAGDGFYVADDGPGIPADERDAVFDMGYTTSDGATGYGLAIVQRIAQAHAWNVAVGEGSRGGARFDVTGVATL